MVVVDLALEWLYFQIVERLPNKAGWKTFGLMAGCQLTTYFLFSVNARALAQGRVAWTFFSDLLYAAVGYYIIRLVGKNESRMGQLGYVMGGAVGSIIAIELTKWLFGQ